MTFLLTGQGNNRIDRQFENDINETRIKIVKIATIGYIYIRIPYIREIQTFSKIFRSVYFF